MMIGEKMTAIQKLAILYLRSVCFSTIRQCDENILQSNTFSPLMISFLFFSVTSRDRVRALGYYSHFFLYS